MLARVRGRVVANTLAYPYDAIAFITVSLGGVGYEGSGVLISPDEVLTASHMVWSTGVGTATDIEVSPGYNNGTSYFGTFSGVVTHYNPINDTGGLISLKDSASDYALIHLSTPVPAAVGSFALGADFSSGAVTVSGYPGYSGNQFDVAESVTTLASANLLTGASLGAGSSGGPVWTQTAAGATVLGTVSTGTATTGYFNKITAGERATLQAWVAQDEALPGVAPLAGWIDSSTGVQGTGAVTAASAGGPSFLQWQYIWNSSDGVALSTGATNVFLHGGPGQDSIEVTSGQNVLDGGTGSNFLTGGTGIDTFFTDARSSEVVWNTLRNFHAGDAATLWGFVPGVSSYSWDFRDRRRRGIDRRHAAGQHRGRPRTAGQRYRRQHHVRRAVGGAGEEPAGRQRDAGRGLLPLPLQPGGVTLRPWPSGSPPAGRRRAGWPCPGTPGPGFPGCPRRPPSASRTV